MTKMGQDQSQDGGVNMYGWPGATLLPILSTSGEFPGWVDPSGIGVTALITPKQDGYLTDILVYRLEAEEDIE